MSVSRSTREKQVGAAASSFIARRVDGVLTAVSTVLFVTAVSTVLFVAVELSVPVCCASCAIFATASAFSL